MPDRAGEALEHEQAARRTVGKRLLGDAVGREGVVEVGGAHGRKCGTRKWERGTGAVQLLRVPPSAFRVQLSNIVDCSALLGGVNPKRRVALTVAQQPRRV